MNSFWRLIKEPNPAGARVAIMAVLAQNDVRGRHAVRLLLQLVRELAAKA